MRKKLAAIMVKMAIKLHPEAATEAIVPIYENYEAKTIGVAQELTKNDLRKFKMSNNVKSSRVAMRQLVGETVRKNVSRVLETAKEIIEISTYKRGDSMIVETRLNVYVKAKSNEEAGEDTSE